MLQFKKSFYNTKSVPLCTLSIFVLCTYLVSQQLRYGVAMSLVLSPVICANRINRTEYGSHIA